MKKSFLLIVCAVALVLGFSSCGKKQEEIKMIPASAVKISGGNKEFLKINADSVKIMLVNTDVKYDTWAVRALIPIANTQAWNDDLEDKYNVVDYAFGLDVAFVDQNGNEVGEDFYVENEGKLLSVIKSKTEGESDDILVKCLFENLYGSYEENKNIFDKVAGIDISGMEFAEKVKNSSYSSSSSSSYSSSDSDDDDYSSSDSDEDWDDFLDEYEEYVDDYVALYKKAMNGDMDALSEYAEVLEDAQDLNNKLSKAKNTMSSSQIARYTKITNKMLNAMK